MAIKLLIKKAILPGAGARAYQIILTDTEAFFLHLGRDWKGFGGGGVRTGSDAASLVGGLIGSAIVAAKGKKSDRLIAEKLEDIDYTRLEEEIAADSKSARVLFSDIKSIKSRAKSVWMGEASFFFRTKKGTWNFRLFTEEDRLALDEFFRNIRPELFP